MNLNLLIAVLVVIAAALLFLAYVRLRRARGRSRGTAQPTTARGEAAAGQPAVPEIVTLGGRDFRRMQSEGTVKWNGYLMGCLRRAKLIPLPDMQDSETPGEYGLRLLAELLERDALAPCLGALLIPAELEPGGWTPEVAKQTSAFVEQLTDPQDHAKLNREAISILLGFFEDGIASSLISLNSSSSVKTQRDDPAIGEPSGIQTSGEPSYSH